MIHNLNYSSDTVIIKSRIWAGHVAYIWETGCTYKTSVVKWRKKRLSGSLT
jgi:hypothetical protein